MAHVFCRAIWKMAHKFVSHLINFQAVKNTFIFLLVSLPSISRFQLGPLKLREDKQERQSVEVQFVKTLPRRHNPERTENRTLDSVPGRKEIPSLQTQQSHLPCKQRVERVHVTEALRMEQHGDGRTLCRRSRDRHRSGIRPAKKHRPLTTQIERSGPRTTNARV